MEQKKKMLINAAYYALIVGAYIFFFRFIMYRIMPFFIAIIVALLVNRPASAISSALRIPRRGIAAIFVLIFYAALGAVFTLIILRLFWIVANLAESIPSWYTGTLQPMIQDFLTWYQNIAENLNPKISTYIDEISPVISRRGLEFANYAASAVLKLTRSVLMSVPKTVLSVIVCIIASFLVSMDFPKIRHFFLAQLPDSGKDVANKTIEYLGTSFRRICISYFLIIIITFTELLIGFYIIKVDNMVHLALMIAVLDVLPIIGVGTALIPWGIVLLVRGDYLRGAEILILYAVIYVVRQIIEPKIVGNRVGLSPVLVLISIFIGISLLGPLGIFILPLTLVVVKNLNDNGYIQLFNSDYLGQPRAQSAQAGDAEPPLEAGGSGDNSET